MKAYIDLAATIEAKPGDPVAIIIQDELESLMQANPEHRPVLTTHTEQAREDFKLMNYQVEGNLRDWTFGPIEYPSIIMALEANKVLNIERTDAGFTLTEGGDNYYDVNLTPEQLAAFGQELIDLARNKSS